MVIGVLAIQGSVVEHMQALKKIGAQNVAIKSKEDLAKVDGLIIPGGESTTMGKLLKLYGLDEEIKKRCISTRRPLAVWGTCAGAILLAKKVHNRPPENLKLMDIEIERNAYGSQLDSFQTEISAPELGASKISAVFIRAPKVRKTSQTTQTLAEYGGSPVMVRQKNMLVTMFHPELTDDTRIHRYFISLTKHYANQQEKN